MHAQEPDPPPHGQVNRFVPVALSKPALAAALGIDGGAIFQVLAVENLGLSPSAIGIAYGVGLLSLPLQLWAARMPLRLARRNVQIFLLLAAFQCLLLAWLIGIGATHGLATTALAVTVTAEVAISVLFVTAWQPLLSTRATSRDRQRINAGWTALGRGLLAGLLILFAAAEVADRSLLLVALALLAIGVAFNFGRLPMKDVPRPPSPSATETPPSGLTPAMWWILASFAALNLGALPLWLMFLAEVMWPDANLGAVGAIQTIAVVAGLLAWRPTRGDLGRRAMTGVMLVVISSVALFGIGHEAQGTAAQASVLVVTVVMTFGMMYASLALLEMAHRLTKRQEDAVRIFTFIDIVDSSALQLGLFLGGLLVASSVRASSSTPYVAFVVVMSALALTAVWRTVRVAKDST